MSSMELLCALFRSTFLFLLWPATLSLSLPTFMTTSRYCLIMISNIMLKQCCYYSRVIIYRKFIPFTLILEFVFFYVSIQGSSEVLQCPRCQASVPPHPGVCGTCGENVYQCHKCRAINYDEKDPFLCNSCGFSKYGKFDTFLEARPCSAVDPIESEEDRLKVRSPVVYLCVEGMSTGISHP